MRLKKIKLKNKTYYENINKVKITSDEYNLLKTLQRQINTKAKRIDEMVALTQPTIVFKKFRQVDMIPSFSMKSLHTISARRGMLRRIDQLKQRAESLKTPPEVIKERRSQAMKKYWNSMSAEKRLEYSRKAKDRWDRLPDEIKTQRIESLKRGKRSQKLVRLATTKEPRKQLNITEDERERRRQRMQSYHRKRKALKLKHEENVKSGLEWDIVKPPKKIDTNIGKIPKKKKDILANVRLDVKHWIDDQLLLMRENMITALTNSGNFSLEEIFELTHKLRQMTEDQFWEFVNTFNIKDIVKFMYIDPNRTQYEEINDALNRVLDDESLLR